MAPRRTSEVACISSMHEDGQAAHWAWPADGWAAWSRARSTGHHPLTRSHAALCFLSTRRYLAAKQQAAPSREPSRKSRFATTASQDDLAGASPLTRLSAEEEEEGGDDGDDDDESRAAAVTIGYAAFVEFLCRCAHAKFAEVAAMPMPDRLEGLLAVLSGDRDEHAVFAEATQQRLPAGYLAGPGGGHGGGAGSGSASSGVAAGGGSATIVGAVVAGEGASERALWAAVWQRLHLDTLHGFPLWSEEVHDLLHAAFTPLRMIFSHYSVDDAEVRLLRHKTPAYDATDNPHLSFSHTLSLLWPLHQPRELLSRAIACSLTWPALWHGTRRTRPTWPTRRSASRSGSRSCTTAACPASSPTASCAKSTASSRRRATAMSSRSTASSRASCTWPSCAPTRPCAARGRARRPRSRCRAVWRASCGSACWPSRGRTRCCSSRGR